MTHAEKVSTAIANAIEYGYSDETRDRMKKMCTYAATCIDKKVVAEKFCEKAPQSYGMYTVAVGSKKFGIRQIHGSSFPLDYVFAAFCELLLAAQGEGNIETAAKTLAGSIAERKYRQYLAGLNTARFGVLQRAGEYFRRIQKEETTTLLV